MNRLAVAILGCCLFVQQASAQEAVAEQIIAEHKIPISRTGPESYAGPGWDRLIDEGRRSQFFLIGERHGVHDIALFIKAAHRDLATQAGFTHAALEVGPYSTEFAEQLVRSGRGQLANYIGQPGHEFAIPFLFFSEEAALAEQMVQLSPDTEKTLWGLDQEFAGAAPIAIDFLRDRSRTAEQRAAVEAFSARSSDRPDLIATLASADLEPLEQAFRSDAQATALLAELRFSNEVYAPFMRRDGAIYSANLARETSIKLNFARQFADAEQRRGSSPKVFLKFGANHAMRGLSGTDVPTLANFLAEWGLPRGFALVNVMVDCAGGEMLNPQTNQPLPCSGNLGNDGLFARLATDEVTLIDFKALRPRLQELPEIDSRTRQAILAFDYYVMIKDPAAASRVPAHRD